MREFWENVKTYLTNAMTDKLFAVLAAIVILIVGFLLIKWLMRIMDKIKLFQRMDRSVYGFIRSLLSVLLKALLLLIVAVRIGVPEASIVALIGSAGLAIGLALQGGLSNLAGGMMILVFKPFRVGDFIAPTNAEKGTVTEINIFYTNMKTPDNRKVVVPNGELANGTIVNYTAMDIRRVDMTFSVAYNQDVETVRNILLDIANSHDKVLHDEQSKPTARLSEMGDSALIFTLKLWCKTDDYWDVYFDINERTKQMFDAQGITIPYKQLDVHVKPQ